MKVQITDFLHDPHPRVLDGSPEEIEQFLREKFWPFAQGVPEGDLYALVQEISRSHYIGVVFLDAQPEPKPHLHPSQKKYQEDPWIREGDFSEHFTLSDK
jgi:hypothetical protein